MQLSNNAHRRDQNRLQDMCYAAQNGDLDTVRTLVESGVPINQPTSKVNLTPLYYASLFCHTEIIQYLLMKGATKTLHTAVLLGDLETVKKLLDTGADVNEELSTFKETPLLLAIRREDLAVVCLLITRGANVNAISYDTFTPLCAAAEHARADLVRTLLDAGADPNLLPKHGMPALMRAKSVEVARLLVEAGADVNAVCSNDNRWEVMGWTPLMFAIIYRTDNLECIRFLIEQGIMTPGIRTVV